MRRSWTSDEDQFVRNNYGVMSPADIAARLDRTRELIVWRAGVLGVRQSRNPAWTDAENQFLRENYPMMADEEISARLGRSLVAVNHQAGRLGITKIGPYSDWTEDEDELLDDLYGTMAPGKLADLLGRSEAAMTHRAMRLGVNNRQRRPEKRARQRLRNDTVLTMRWDAIRHDYFSQIDGHMKAYVLGWLASDGNVKTAGNSIRLRVNSKDLGMLDLIRKELAPLHGISHYLGPRPLGGVSPMSGFEVNSDQMKQDLIKLGVTPNKSLTLRYPRIPPEYDNSFILGYFDGDGCLCKSGRYWKWSIVCAAPVFLAAVRDRIKDATGIEVRGPHLHDKANSPHTHHINTSGSKVIPVDAWLHADMPGLARKRLPQGT